jgi:hypothetical protein
MAPVFSRASKPHTSQIGKIVGFFVIVKQIKDVQSLCWFSSMYGSR